MKYVWLKEDFFFKLNIERIFKILLIIKNFFIKLSKDEIVDIKKN